MSTLKFGNNWRRELLLTKEASGEDLDTVCPYILLDESKIPVRISSFCLKNWNEFGFDYDTSTFMLWPADDHTKIETLAEEINKVYPESAKIVKMAVSDAHNLSLMWEDEEEENGLGIDESEDLLQDDATDLNF